MNTHPRWWAAPLAFAAVWLLLVVGGRANFFRDPGTFWHTAVGDKIVRDGFFDRDPYTWTFAGDEWIPHQWLGEVTMSAVYRVGGLDGLLVGACAVLAGVYATVGVRLAGTGGNPVLAVLVLGLVLAASATHFHVRPHLVTIAGVALTAAVLADVDAGRAGVRRLFALVPAYLVWVNAHGGVLGGLGMLALTLIGWAIDGVVRGRGPVTTWRAGLVAAAAAGLCAGVVVVTPYGPRVAGAWLKIMDMPSLPDIIREHARTDPRDPTNWPTFALGVGYVALLAGVPVRRWRVVWLLPLFWLVQALLRVRHAPLFAVTAGLVAADVWPHTRWAAGLLRRRPDLYTPAAGAGLGWTVRGALLAAVPVLFAWGLQAGGVHAPVLGRGWAVLAPDLWPVDLDRTLHDYAPAPGSPDRTFNDYTHGGYLILYHPEYKVFVDDRCELFGDAWLVRFVRAGETDPAAAAALDAWQSQYGRFDHALTRPGTPFDVYFAARPVDWHPLALTPGANFYRRSALATPPAGR